jgi:hypothetical protein
MRLFFVLVLPAVLSGACTPFIPIKDAFSVSAVVPTGNIPPEFALFNRYDPQVNAVVSDQMCVTPYILDTEKSLRATPGEFIAWRGRCERYQVWLAKLAEYSPP